MASTAYALHIQIHHNKNIEQKQGEKTVLYFLPFCYFAVLGLLLSFFLGVAPQTCLTFFIAKKTLRAAFAKS